MDGVSHAIDRTPNPTYLPTTKPPVAPGEGHQFRPHDWAKPSAHAWTDTQTNARSDNPTPHPKRSVKPSRKKTMIYSGKPKGL